jgi:hypothetical protein
VHLLLRNDSPSFHPVHSLIRAFGPRDLHHAKGRGHALAQMPRPLLLAFVASSLLFGCTSADQSDQPPPPSAPSRNQTPAPAPSGNQIQRVFSPTTWKHGPWPFTLKDSATLVVNGVPETLDRFEVCIATAADTEGNIYTLNGIAAGRVKGPNVYNIDKITNYEIGSPRPLLDAALASCERG